MMTDSQTDLQTHSELDNGAVLHQPTSLDETLQPQLIDGVDSNDLFGGPGCDFNLEFADDRSLLSGDHAPCSLDELAEASQRDELAEASQLVQSSWYFRCFSDPCA